VNINLWIKNEQTHTKRRNKLYAATGVVEGLSLAALLRRMRGHDAATRRGDAPGQDFKDLDGEDGSDSGG